MAVAPTGWNAHLQRELDRLEREGLLRTVPAVDRDEPPFVRRNGRRLLSFASNDYLGLASHPALVDASREALRAGAGATASRLVSGGSSAYCALESRLAEFKRTEAALVFGSGYLANVGAISALVGRGDAVFTDRLNHASIVDGCRLSGASIHRYPHLDVARLESMLGDPALAGARKLIITETLFGMNGDFAPLEELVELKERFGAALMVDEAHAGGLFGPCGEGYAYERGLEASIDLHMGTFGKAFGAYGAYVAGEELWIRYLLNRSRSFIYTTALPPAVIAAIGAGIDVVGTASDRRAKVRSMADRFRRRLETSGLRYEGSGSQIIPVLVGKSATTLELSRRLEERGVLAPAMRPPTVPAGQACLRFSITSSHDPAHIDLAVEAVHDSFALLAG